MKYKPLVLISLFLLIGCKYFKGDHCNNTLSIVGTYENTYDKNAKNLLIIKENGTFEQIFTKGTITKKNTGEWELFNESCSIHLKNLKLMHELGKYEKKAFVENGLYRLNKIMFVEDLPYEFDFYRVE